MIIGVPKEVKDHEYRVGITPNLVKTLTDAGHRVLIETAAGQRIGFTDEMYAHAGASVASCPKEVYEAELIVKVKEPQPQEFLLLKEGQILFCYLHLAAEPELTKQLVARKVVAIAYETIEDTAHHLPLLTPMSEIAGKLSIQVGASSLEMERGGKGVLLGGVPGVAPAKVCIIGGGVVGSCAARIAMGMGADVTILDHTVSRLRQLDSLFGPRLKTLFSSEYTLQKAIAQSDLVIGAVLVHGGSAPKLIKKSWLQQMAPGSVIVDVAIDQGGCAETSHPTTHSHPTYLVDGVVHYCVTNMPGACARTATYALTNATLPYLLTLANRGYKEALKADGGFLLGLNTCRGHITHVKVAESLGHDWIPATSQLSQ